jgi:Protein-L-isoaspartate(D-aspartate) O-methyltransferase (PCMT)
MVKTDNDISIEKYRSKAASYDASAEYTMPLRERTIALLQLKPGDVVLDTGAGTGLSYGLLRRAVGPRGRVLAFEQSPEMFVQAQDRVRREGWSNIWQTLSLGEHVELCAKPSQRHALRWPESNSSLGGLARLTFWPGSKIDPITPRPPIFGPHGILSRATAKSFKEKVPSGVWAILPKAVCTSPGSSDEYITSELTDFNA